MGKGCKNAKNKGIANLVVDVNRFKNTEDKNRAKKTGKETSGVGEKDIYEGILRMEEYFETQEKCPLIGKGRILRTNLRAKIGKGTLGVGAKG